jgi:AraC-like DNA-binding protein
MPGRPMILRPDLLSFGPGKGMGTRGGPSSQADDAGVSSKDPLSDLLRVIRLDGAFFCSVEASGSWGVKASAGHQLLPEIMPWAEHLISCHIVTEGRCYGGLVGEELVELTAGDVIVFPHGDAHVMASGREVGVHALTAGGAPAGVPDRVVLGDGGIRTASFICGFLGCDLRPFNLLLASLPRRMRVPGLANSWLGGLALQVTGGTKLSPAGRETVLTRLAELMLIEAVRRYLDGSAPEAAGWLAGFRDEVVGRALALLHARPGAPWTIAELARESASSRSKLAERFTTLVGQPPMQYLTRWRMQIAAGMLAKGGAKVAAIGSEVGYGSEAAFSRAFKRATGSTPGVWRTARRSPRC